jgi:formate dehydrogenase accessory protein FdhE
MEGLVAAPRSMEAWAARRRRTGQLAGRYPFAAELLRLYEALLDVQERAFLRARDDRPDPLSLPAYVAEHVMADVVEATVEAGPSALAVAVRDRLRDGDPAEVVAAWLGGEPQTPVDEYLARAAAGPVLEALGPVAGDACPGRVTEGGCPRCGGRPQVSFLPAAAEALVSGPRMLQCCRCGESWIHQRMTCANCGEQSTTKLPIFADGERFPHLRADACETCRRYVITVDLRKDPEAVPIVDELVALPLDLDVRERGFAKIVPNLMAIG